MKRLLAVVVGLALLGQSACAWAEDSTIEQIGYGTGSVIGSAVYFPFKATFCILGGISSGFAWVIAGREKATEIASTTCRGTWAITPDVVKGKERVHFVGDVPAAGAKASSTPGTSASK